MIVPSACNEAQPDDIAPIVLMPGDPRRATFVAETYLTETQRFNRVRNMDGYTGLYEGVRVSVMGSGMGIPSMMLYAYELFHYFNVQAIYRVGSAGGLGELAIRDLVLASGASTNSCIVKPDDFPGLLAPVADYASLSTAVATASRLGLAVKVAPVFTSDYFYHPLPDAAERIKKLGHVALEMETAGLYVAAQRAGRKALSFLTISDDVLTGQGLTAEEREASFHDMAKLALETAKAALKSDEQD